MGRMFERKDTRKFELKPRYWDPEKEEREEREKRVRAELGNDDVYVPHIDGKFRNLYKERKANRRGYNGRYAIRMFLILIAVFLIVFYLFMRHSEGVFRFFGM